MSTQEDLVAGLQEALRRVEAELKEKQVLLEVAQARVRERREEHEILMRLIARHDPGPTSSEEPT